MEEVSEKIIIRETVREVPQNCPGSIGPDIGTTVEGKRDFVYSIERIFQGSKPIVSNDDMAVFDFPEGSKELNFSGKTVPFGEIVITIY